MSHVDHAHDPEGDCQPDRREQQHRPGAEPEEQVLAEPEEADPGFDRVERLARGRADLRIIVPCRGRLQPHADLAEQRAAQQRDGLETLFGVIQVQARECADGQ
jgi:hypothetical protein